MMCLAVYEAARSAVAACRAGRGPVLLELLTYRRTGHSRRDACHYQPNGRTCALACQRPDRAARPAIDSNAGLSSKRNSKQSAARFRQAISNGRRGGSAATIAFSRRA